MAAKPTRPAKGPDCGVPRFGWLAGAQRRAPTRIVRTHTPRMARPCFQGRLPRLKGRPAAPPLRVPGIHGTGELLESELVARMRAAVDCPDRILPLPRLAMPPGLASQPVISSRIRSRTKKRQALWRTATRMASALGMAVLFVTFAILEGPTLGAP